MAVKIYYRNPKELQRIVDSKQPELFHFLKKLAKNRPADLDKCVLELHNSLFSAFSCLDCANCCKSLGPGLTDTDIERLAKFLKIKSSGFIGQYVNIDEEVDRVFKSNPCPFLLPDNFCSVYESRPKACRDYPHTNRRRFYQITDLTFKNSAICPVVFEIVEELRQRYR